MLVGGLVYIAGMTLCTIFFNVPLNNALDGTDPASVAAASIWAHYLKAWTLWNHVRTISSTVRVRYTLPPLRRNDITLESRMNVEKIVLRPAGCDDAPHIASIWCAWTIPRMLAACNTGRPYASRCRNRRPCIDEKQNQKAKVFMHAGTLELAKILCSK